MMLYVIWYTYKISEKKTKLFNGKFSIKLIKVQLLKENEILKKKATII